MNFDWYCRAKGTVSSEILPNFQKFWQIWLKFANFYDFYSEIFRESVKIFAKNLGFCKALEPNFG